MSRALYLYEHLIRIALAIDSPFNQNKKQQAKIWRYERAISSV